MILRDIAYDDYTPLLLFYHLYLLQGKCNSRNPASLQIEDKIFNISSLVRLNHSPSSLSEKQ